MARKELDRFDTKAKRDIQIAAKLTALIVLAIILGAAMVVVCLEVSDYTQKGSLKDDITHTGVGAQRILVDWGVTCESNAILLASSPDIVYAVEQKDPDLLSKAISSKCGQLDFEGVAVVGTDGYVLKGGGYDIDDGTNLSGSKAVQSALRGSGKLIYEAMYNFPYAQAYAAPIKSNGIIIGAVITCYNLATDDFITVMKNGFQVECTILSGDLRVASTLNNMAGTRLQNDTIIQTVLQKGQPYKGANTISGKQYLCTSQPIGNEGEKPNGMIFIAKSMSEISKTKYATLKIIVPIALVTIILLLIFSLRFIRWLMWRIENVTSFLREMATGEADLTKRCKLFIRDEIGDLVIQFDFFLDKMQSIIGELKMSKYELTSSGDDMTNSANDTAESIMQIIANIEGISSLIRNQGQGVEHTASTLEEISRNIVDLNAMIQNQSTSVSQASSAVEQMVGNISSVNNSVDRMANSFELLSSNAQTGFNKQQDVNERIKQIENQSQMLQEANAAISSIAEQTNLLAMNAAIEAAHAGEAGKGFSVVADEIRKLSETSSAQSKTIGEQLSSIMESISQVVEASQQSSEAFVTVQTKIKETDVLVSQIKNAMEEQNSGSKQITDALKMMNDNTIEVHQSSTDMSQKNERIKNEMKELQSVTNSMKQSMQEVASDANRINKNGNNLKDISEQMHTSIAKIGKQVDLFTV